MERSSDQVVRPLYQEALTKWVGKIPDEVVNDMANIAPMLATLGYDPNANPPSYGQPEVETVVGAGGPEQQRDDDQQDQQQQQQEDLQDQQQYETSANGDAKPQADRKR